MTALRMAAGSAVVALWPGIGQAHAFKTGAAYPQFVEGAGAALGEPAVLLSMVALGLLAALWHSEGLVRLWPALLGGMLIGVVPAAVAGPSAVVAALAAGLVCAAIAALGARLPAGAVIPLAALTGLATSLAMLAGHGFAELPVPIYAGLLFGANLVLATSASSAKLLLDRWSHPAIRLGLRIASSWIGAIAILLIAFSFRQI
jgi:hypothetical protein